MATTLNKLAQIGKDRVGRWRSEAQTNARRLRCTRGASSAPTGGKLKARTRPLHCSDALSLSLFTLPTRDTRLETRPVTSSSSPTPASPAPMAAAAARGAAAARSPLVLHRHPHPAHHRRLRLLPLVSHSAPVSFPPRSLAPSSWE